MPSNPDTLVNCAVSWFRLLLLRAESEEWTDEFGVYLNSKDTDVQRTEEYLQVACSIAQSDAATLCLYAQFLEKKRDFVAAEGMPFLDNIAIDIGGIWKTGCVGGEGESLVCDKTLSDLSLSSFPTLFFLSFSPSSPSLSPPFLITSQLGEYKNVFATSSREPLRHRRLP